MEPDTKGNRRFNVHYVLRLEDSISKIKELKSQGFQTIGAEIPESVSGDLMLDHNILHQNGQAACIAALGFRNLLYKNLVVVSKLDLDALATIAVLRKVAYKKTFTVEELEKLEIISRYDIGTAAPAENMEMNKLMGLLNGAKFYEKWDIVSKWLSGEINVHGEKAQPKEVRQMLLEKYDRVLVVISFGQGAFARDLVQSNDFVLALNPDTRFLTGRGRRYCISSYNYDLSYIQDALNKKDKSSQWGGHSEAGIICSSPSQSSQLEIPQIVELLHEATPYHD